MLKMERNFSSFVCVCLGDDSCDTGCCYVVLQVYLI